MKKNIILSSLMVLTLFACQKESEVKPEVSKPNFYVENGILNVKNQAVLDSLVAANSEKSEEEVVAWGKAINLKSLASTYLDAEKEKEALTFAELKAKYEGKLVFNNADPKEKQFTCAVKNLELAAFVNEDAKIVVNGEVRDLKDTDSANFMPFANNPSANILKSGGIGTNYLQSIEGKRCMQVWTSGCRFTNGQWTTIGLGIYTEKKVWGGWIGCNTGLNFRNGAGQMESWYCEPTDNLTLHPGHYAVWPKTYWTGYSRIWTGGVSEGRGITFSMNYNGDLNLSY